MTRRCPNVYNSTSYIYFYSNAITNQLLIDNKLNQIYTEEFLLFEYHNNYHTTLQLRKPYHSRIAIAVPVLGNYNYLSMECASALIDLHPLIYSASMILYLLIAISLIKDLSTNDCLLLYYIRYL